MNAIRGIINRKRKRDFSTDEPDRNWKGPRLFTGRPRPPPSVRSPSDVIPPEVEDEQNKCKWWQEYKKKNIIAFDVEAAQRFVISLDKDGYMYQNDQQLPAGTIVKEREPTLPKAAYIAAVKYKGEEIFNKKILHKPGTFRVDYFSRTISGISRTGQLEDGEPFHDVVEDFEDTTKGKFVITCGGACDYLYMELSPHDKEDVDLQSFYMRPSIQNPSKMEAMSLRDIFFCHFNDDFQRGIHKP